MSISAHSFKLNMDLKEFKKETGLAASDFKMLRREVANTKTLLEKMQENIDKATIAYKKGAISGEAYRRMLDKLNAEQEKSGSTSGFAKMKKDVLDLGSSMTGLSASSLTAVGAFAAIGAAGVKTISMIKGQWEELNAVMKFSDSTGFSENFVLSFQSAAKYATDLNSDQVSDGLRTFSRNLSILAATGTGEAAPALKLFNLEMKDLAGLDADEQLKVVATGFSGLGSMAEKSAAAVKLFGEQGQKMIPMLEGGAVALNKFQESAARRGLSFTAAELAAIEKNIDRISMVEEDVDIFKKGFSMEAAKALDTFADGFASVGINMKDLGVIAFKTAIPIYALADALGNLWIAADPPPELAGNTKATLDALKDIKGIEGIAGETAALMAAETAALMAQKLTTLQQVDQKIAELSKQYGEYGLADVELAKLKQQRAELIKLSADVKKINDDKAAADKAEAKIGGADAAVQKMQQELDLFGLKGRELEIAKMRNEAFKEEQAGHAGVANALRERIQVLEELDSQLDKKEAKEQAAADKAKKDAADQKEADKLAAKTEEDRKKDVAAIRESMKTDEQKFQDEVKRIRDLTGGPLGLSKAEAEAAIEAAREKMKEPLKAEAEINMSFSMQSKNGLDVTYAGSSYDPSEFVTTSRDVTSNAADGVAGESRDYLKIMAEKDPIVVEEVQSL